MAAFNVCICISTFNRPQRLLALLKDIERERGDYSIYTIILDDGSLPHRNHPADESHYQAHEGKQGYWRTITTLWLHAKNIDATFYLQIPDDVRLVPGFFTEILEQWHAIDNPRKAMLNPLVDTRRTDHTQWTPLAVSWETHGAYRFRNSAWNDCCFLAPRSTMEALAWQIAPQHTTPSTVRPVSTGVGRNISRRLYQAGYALYHCATPLVTHGAHASQMHPQRAQAGQILTTERIVAGMATYNSQERLETLPLVLKSLLPQVDELRVYWNGTGIPPACLHHEKIRLYDGTKDPHGDLADQGKLFDIAHNSYILLVDDDIMYDRSFVANILAGVERYDRKALVGYHGVILKHWPLDTSYYNERIVFHGAAGLDEDTAVHLVATSSCAWHTSTFRPTGSLEEGKYMADLWLGRAAQEAKVPVVCLAHKAKWLKPLVHKETIWNTWHTKDTPQAEYVNCKPWTIYPLPDRIHGE